MDSSGRCSQLGMKIIKFPYKQGKIESWKLKGIFFVHDDGKRPFHSCRMGHYYHTNPVSLGKIHTHDLIESRKERKRGSRLVAEKKWFCTTCCCRLIGPLHAYKYLAGAAKMLLVDCVFATTIIRWCFSQVLDSKTKSKIVWSMLALNNKWNVTKLFTNLLLPTP